MYSQSSLSYRNAATVCVGWDRLLVCVEDPTISAPSPFLCFATRKRLLSRWTARTDRLSSTDLTATAFCRASMRTFPPRSLPCSHGRAVAVLYPAGHPIRGSLCIRVPLWWLDTIYLSGLHRKAHKIPGILRAFLICHNFLLQRLFDRPSRTKLFLRRAEPLSSASRSVSYARSAQRRQSSEEFDCLGASMRAAPSSHYRPLPRTKTFSCLAADRRPVNFPGSRPS